MDNHAIDEAKRDNLGQLLLRAARLFDEVAFERFARRHGRVRRAHLQLMPHLDLDGTRITELARRANITKQAVGQLVTALEDEGYVERQPDPSDQRAKIVTLTRRGRKAMLDGLSIFKTLQAELVEEAGPAEVRQLIDALEQVLPFLEAKRG